MYLVLTALFTKLVKAELCQTRSLSRVLTVAPSSALVIKHCSLIVLPALLCFACVCIAVVLFLYYLVDTNTDIVTNIWHGLSDLTSVTIPDTDIILDMTVTSNIDISYTDYMIYAEY